MISGRSPFQGQKALEVVGHARAALSEGPLSYAFPVPPEYAALMDGLLVIDRNSRLGMRDVDKEECTCLPRKHECAIELP